jgi:uncharacterized protein (DUF111 family)
LDDVTLHEVGAWDSVADIVGAAHVLETLKPRTWSLSPLPIGGGRVNTAQGGLAGPAPATVKLLEGFLMLDDGIGGERVTPTGAAILRSLRVELGPPAGAPEPLQLSRSGNGFGARTLPGLSNVLRVLGFEQPDGGRLDERIGVIQFEVDDQTPEDLALGLEVLRARSDVLDVVQMPAMGKKGRFCAHIQVLCQRDSLAGVVDACFTETTTIGLRWHVTARTVLERDTDVVESEGRAVRVTRAKRPGGRVSAKAEAEDVRGSSGRGGRERLRALVEKSAPSNAGGDA